MIIRTFTVPNNQSCIVSENHYNHVVQLLIIGAICIHTCISSITIIIYNLHLLDFLHL